MTVIQGIILGFIQGMAEFLPISSSGHLVLFQRIFGLQEGAMTFNIAVHLATLLGVFFVLREDIWAIIKKPFGKLTLLLVAGTIPTGIIAFLFNDFIESLFTTGAGLSIGFIITGILLWYAESTREKSIKSRNKKLDEMGYIDAVVIGIAQGVAVVPGISRSGSTLAASLIKGLNREFALRFSFLMSIPPILGAALKDGYDVLKSEASLTGGVEVLPLIAGMVSAAVFGYLAVKFMIKIFTRVSLKIFSYYVFTLGGLILIDQIFFGIFFDKIF